MLGARRQREHVRELMRVCLGQVCICVDACLGQVCICMNACAMVRVRRRAVCMGDASMSQDQSGHCSSGNVASNVSTLPYRYATPVVLFLTRVRYVNFIEIFQRRHHPLSACAREYRGVEVYSAACMYVRARILHIRARAQGDTRLRISVHPSMCQSIHLSICKCMREGMDTYTTPAPCLHHACTTPASCLHHACIMHASARL
jgi:hypothetical protein